MCGIQLQKAQNSSLSVYGLSLNHCEDPRQRGEQRLAAWPNTVALQVVSPTISLKLGIQRLRLYSSQEERAELQLIS